jgi:hypothetical protein
MEAETQNIMAQVAEMAILQEMALMVQVVREKVARVIH